MKTSDKALIAALVVVFIGMATAFIGALSSSDNADGKALPEQKASVQVIYSDDLDANDNEDSDKEDEEQEIAITGSALEKASNAALAYIGEGRVTDSEVGDEEGYYEIEITLNNKREVDVHLDENFEVLSVEYE